MDKTVLEVREVSKQFENTYALDKVSFSINKGEVVGLIGANGSGKSTLMNIIFANSNIRESGGYQGEILIDNQKVNFKSATDAIRQGIGMIHQEFMLIPDMTVSENISITREHTHSITDRILGKPLSLLDNEKNKKDSIDVLERLGFQINHKLQVKNISVNAKQFVEIAREINRKDLKLLILDEPTAALNHTDSGLLLTAVRALANSGVSVIFCSHRLQEVKELCDTVHILRDGKLVSSYQKEEFDLDTFAHQMMGYEVKETVHHISESSEEVVLKYKNVSADMPGELLRGLDLDVYKGEILGVSSLSGHGKLAMAYAAMGFYPIEGEMYYNGNLRASKSSYYNMEEGFYMISDDRKNMGLLMNHSIKDNILFPLLQNACARKMKMKERDSLVQEQRKLLEIKCDNLNQKVRELSGGNQQKVCLAAANLVAPKVLFVLEPTRGVDIGSKERILEMLVKMNAEQNTTIILVSSELEELKRISHRIVILCEGKLSKILPPDSKNELFALAYTGDVENEDKN